MSDVSVWICVVGAALVAACLIRRVTVFEHQRGLKYSGGRFVKIVNPGVHWLLRPRTVIRLVDARARFTTISGQEVLTADGVTVKVSLAVSYQVADPAKAINQVESYESAVYLALQVALRNVFAASSMDEIMEKRGSVGAAIAQAASASVDELGLRLIAADVKDIMLPGEMKRLFAQVVKAKKEGQAMLEQARAETAAIRHLLNIARNLEEHPALLQLRALQRLSESPNNTLFLGVPSSMAVVPAIEKKSVKPEPVTDTDSGTDTVPTD